VIEQKGHYLGKDAWTENRDEALHLITDKNGLAQYDGLALGTYNLIEVKAPEGYDLLTEKIPFEISENSPAQLTTLNIENSLSETPVIDQKGSIRIIKVDSEHTEHRLAGAEFILKREGLYYTSDATFSRDINQALRFKTNRYGEVVIKDLPYGPYEIIEVKAPKDYRMLDDAVVVTLDEQEVSVLIKNSSIPISSIPPTGQGNAFIVVAGILVLLGLLIKLWKNK
ncbi:MAG TPA: SpaA isopeptide-forming pilin-related protein, partial [Erysipelothrix sp.]